MLISIFGVNTNCNDMALLNLLILMFSMNANCLIWDSAELKLHNSKQRYTTPYNSTIFNEQVWTMNPRPIFKSTTPQLPQYCDLIGYTNKRVNTVISLATQIAKQE